MQKLSAMSNLITSGIRQGRELLDMTRRVLQTNLRVFQMVLQIQDIITRIPGGVGRVEQEPVYLIDGLGRASPFHLELIRSAEALVSVLAINFRKFGVASKIEKGEFVIEDSSTKEDIDLETDWETCFAPGQRVEMSMVYKHDTFSTATCPRCQTEYWRHYSLNDDEIRW